jgi:hypothetical protein
MPDPNGTVQVPVEIVAGAVTEQAVLLPSCASHKVYVPLILR